MSARTAEEIAALRAIDSPTLSNAIEQFGMRRRTIGYAGVDLRCAFPEMGTMTGYAVTCTADSTSDTRQDGDGLPPAPRPEIHLPPGPRRRHRLVRSLAAGTQREALARQGLADSRQAGGAIGGVGHEHAQDDDAAHVSPPARSRPSAG